MQGFAITVALLAACLCNGEAANSLKCYVCNSLSEAGCDGDRVNKDFLVDCGVGRPANGFPPVRNASVCWKQRQDVEGSIIVDRTCGPELAADRESATCYDRVGTKKIKVRYCACRDSECNSSGALAPSAACLMLLLALRQLLW